MNDSLEGILRQADGNWPDARVAQAKAKIEAYILDIIGEDERVQIGMEIYPNRIPRNELRTEQRSRLKGGCPICGANPMTADCNQSRCDERKE